MKRFDYLIVGSGLSGSTIARLLTDAGKKILVIEKREQVGGNIATKEEDGIVIHLYGPHIFHTSDKFAWDFFNKYVETYDFVNEPLANYHGEIYHMPFNMNTFHELWGVSTTEEAKSIIKKEIEKEGIIAPKNLEEQALSMVGRTIYTKLIKEYTEKQWGRKCTELPVSIIKRLPLRFEWNNNYFNDIYQGQPKGGYSALINNLLSGIETRVGIDYLKNRDALNSLANRVIYTGRLDEFFDFSLGHLDWRSLRFETKTIDQNDFQHNAVVNYTSHEAPYTRIAEHKHFDPHCSNTHSTVITYEYPDTFEEGKIPYYTINDSKNIELANKYKDLAKALPNTYFLGRLANYAYYDMDDAIVEAKKLFEALMLK